ASKAEHLVTARNTLTQMLTGPESRITTRLEVGEMIDGQRAGLVLFGVRPVWIGAIRENGITRVAYASAGVETPGPVISDGVIELRAEVTEDQRVRMAYRVDGGAFVPMGEAEKLW
ncbi:MAG: xylan 1,4-beta-xylosidase, partial [Asticcacaulis sp.]